MSPPPRQRSSKPSSTIRTRRPPKNFWLEFGRRHDSFSDRLLQAFHPSGPCDRGRLNLSPLLCASEPFASGGLGQGGSARGLLAGCMAEPRSDRPQPGARQPDAEWSGWSPPGWFVLFQFPRPHRTAAHFRPRSCGGTCSSAGTRKRVSIFSRASGEPPSLVKLDVHRMGDSATGRSSCADLAANAMAARTSSRPPARTVVCSSHVPRGESGLQISLPRSTRPSSSEC